MIDIWDEMKQLQGQEFHTAKGLAFTYTIKGGEMFLEKVHHSSHRAKLKYYDGLELH